MAAATTTTGSEVSEGPVLTVITKRLRALRKKQNRILQMEESLSQGKILNNEQQEVLRSKPGVVALIEELEKLRQPLSAAAAEEISLATSHLSSSATASAPNKSSDVSADEEETEKEKKTKSSSDVSEVEELLKLLYFGSMFDVKSQSDFTSIMLTRSHERSCCITYDTVTDDDTDLLAEKDLDLISSLSGLLISRPVDSSLSHENALRSCIEQAKLWLANSDQPIEPNAGVTYASLRERLSKIMSSAYFTITPEIRAPKEMPASVAAGVGNFSPSFQVRIGDVDASFVLQQQQHKVEEAPSQHQGLETGENQSGSVEEIQKDEVETEYPAEVISFQQEQVQYETEVQHNEREGEFEQQNGSRRQYQNQKGGRGGARRGFSNGRGGRGRGGGPYQNGRNQFYDQPGNYYPRNYNSRGRGGRANGAAYNNHGPAVQDGHASADIGVAS